MAALDWLQSLLGGGQYGDPGTPAMPGQPMPDDALIRLRRLAAGSADYMDDPGGAPTTPGQPRDNRDQHWLAPGQPRGLSSAAGPFAGRGTFLHPNELGIFGWQGRTTSPGDEVIRPGDARAIAAPYMPNASGDEYQRRLAQQTIPSWRSFPEAAGGVRISHPGTAPSAESLTRQPQTADVGTGIPLNLDRTPVPDTGQGTAWNHLQQAPGDILTAALGLLERGQLGGLNALGLRSPGSDIYRARVPVEPGLRAAEGAATFATGGLASSLFPAAGALRAGAKYAVPPGTLPGLLADEMGGIRAFHGSPHDFDRFDLSKIGTGEGAQAYGHGLYFAENEGVARGYRDAVTQKLGVGMGPANEWLARSGGDPHKALAMFEEFTSGLPPTRAQAEIRAALEIATKPGHMYEVDINADPKSFLDWDKPLGQQATQVQDAVNRVGRDPRFDLGRIADDMRGPELQQLLQSPEATAALNQRGIPGIRYLDQGSRFNPAMLPNNPIANEAREFLKGANGDAAAAWQAFKDSNPMERWGSSERDEIRKVIEAAARQPTSNYAIFDPSIIEILRKYGIIPPVAAGGGLLATGSEPPT